MKKSSTNIFSVFVLKYIVAFGIVAVISLVSSLMSNPFVQLTKGDFFVKSITAGRISIPKPSRGYFYVNVYFIELNDIESKLNILGMKEVDAFGKDNIIGHKAHLEFDSSLAIYKMVINDKLVYETRENWLLFTISIVTFIFASTITVFGLIIEWKRRGVI